MIAYRATLDVPGELAQFEVEFRFVPTAVIAVLVGLAIWWSGRRGRRHALDASG